MAILTTQMEMRILRQRSRCLRRSTNSLLLVSMGICLFLLICGIFFSYKSFVRREKEEAGIEGVILLHRLQNFSAIVPNNEGLKKIRRNHDIGSRCRPSNIHLSPATNIDLTSHNVNMTISFTLPDLPECRQDVVTPKVYYGRQTQQRIPVETSVVPKESLQFQYSNYLRTFQSSWIHHAVLEDLRGGAKDYWYQIRVEKTVKERKRVAAELVTTKALVSTLIYNFTTPPLPSEGIRIALIADWGGSKEALRTMKRMLSRISSPPGSSSSTSSTTTTTKATTTPLTNPSPPPSPTPPLSAIVVAGDISYANSHLPSWESWLDDMQPLYSSIPLLVAAGNHEIECNRKTWQVFQAYESYFRVPNRIVPAHLEPIPPREMVSDCTHPTEFMTPYWYGNSFYSYRHGALQILVLNSYTHTSPGSPQYEWLKHELETNVDRSVTPWLLVVFHCPFHTTFRGHNDERNPRLMMESMEPLFVQHRVNLVLSGHNHAYVRSYPIVGKNSIIDPSHGPIYLTIGTGGDSHSNGPLRPYDPWVAHRDNTEFGFGELMIVNATDAYFQRILNNDNGGSDDRDDDADIDNPSVNPEARDAVWIRNILFP